MRLLIIVATCALLCIPANGYQFKPKHVLAGYAIQYAADDLICQTVLRVDNRTFCFIWGLFINIGASAAFEARQATGPDRNNEFLNDTANVLTGAVGQRLIKIRLDF